MRVLVNSKDKTAQAAFAKCHRVRPFYFVKFLFEHFVRESMYDFIKFDLFESKDSAILKFPLSENELTISLEIVEEVKITTLLLISLISAMLRNYLQRK